MALRLGSRRFASGGWVPEKSGAFWDVFKLGSKGLSPESALESDFGVSDLFGTVSSLGTGWFGSLLVCLQAWVSDSPTAMEDSLLWVQARPRVFVLRG